VVDTPNLKSNDIIPKFENWMDMNSHLTIRETGEQVTPLHLNQDGSLKVVSTSSGEEKDLIADYLF